MRTEPPIDYQSILVTLGASYSLPVERLTFLPLGMDAAVAVYLGIGSNGQKWFIKVKAGEAVGPGPEIASHLHHSGISAVLAPVPTITGLPWARCGGRTLLVYPYIEGEDAVANGLTEPQWRTFGQSLRAVHDSFMPADLRDSVPADPFTVPSLADFEDLITTLTDPTGMTAPGKAFAAYVERNRARINAMIDRARQLQSALATRSFHLVLCHGDIHAANILVETDGDIHLVDWDEPLLAPRERDLLFVIGSRIARDVLPREERWFFEGYGPVEVDPDALILFRYERVIQDLVEFGRDLLASDDLANPDTAFALRIIDTLFAPNGIATRAEDVTLAAIQPD